MFLKSYSLRGPIDTVGAFEGPFSGVSPHVFSELGGPREPFATQSTNVAHAMNFSTVWWLSG